MQPNVTQDNTFQPLDPWQISRLRHVIVGSRNPVKVAAAAAIVRRIAAGATVVGASIASGVPDQPWGDEQTIAGARQRARSALAHGPADLGIGIEGGVVALADGAMRTCAWVVAVAPDGREGIGGSLAMPLPLPVVRRLQAGEELGHAMDAEAGVTGTKHGLGAVGILTAELFTRQSAYEPLVAYALAPFLAEPLFRSDYDSTGSVGR